MARVLAQGVAEGAFRELDPLVTAQLLKTMIDGFGGHAAIGVAPERAVFAVEAFRILIRGVLFEPEHAEAFVAAMAQAAAAERLESAPRIG